MIGVDSGWEIYVAGNGGIKTEVAQFLVKLKTADEVLEYSGAFLQLYREEGWYLERTVHYVSRVGLDHVKKKILDDAAGRKALWERLQFASTASPTPGSSSTRRRSTCASSSRVRGRGRGRVRPHERLDRRSAASTTSPCSARAAWQRAHGVRGGRVPHRRRPGVRAARPLPAQGRPAEPGHRLRRQRGLPAAQLDHRPGRRLRQGARRRLHAPLRVQASSDGEVHARRRRAGARWRSTRRRPRRARHPRRRRPDDRARNPLHLPVLRRRLRRDHRSATARRSPACAATRTTRPTSAACAARAARCT